MYVYFKFGNKADDVKVISNVTLGEDCGPVVNGEPIIYDSAHEDEESATSTATATINNNSSSSSGGGGGIDAICWFKSLPMQAVYIDCSTRDARWCAKSVTIRDTRRQESVRLRRNQAVYHAGSRQSDTVTVEVQEEPETAEERSSFMPASARPLFSDLPGMTSFNPVIDEMFERVEKLCLQWDTLKESRQINREVARILHCYVFPAVTFQKEDVPGLQECLRLVLVKQDAIDRELMAKEKHIKVTTSYLDRLQEVIMTRQDMGSQSYLQACDPRFVDVFYVQITKVIQNSNMQLDMLQTKVNDLKKSAGEGDEGLAAMKKERDELHGGIQKLMVIREAIRNHLYRPFVPKKKKRNKKQHRKVTIDQKDASLHTNFQMVYQQLTGDKDVMKRLCYRKLHFTSMREAIESTVRMLLQHDNQHHHRASFGDFTEFSINANAEGEMKKSWKSMQGRVDGWMERDGTLSQFHLKGCQLIRDLVEGMLSDSRISLIGLDTCPPGQTAELETLPHGKSAASSNAKGSSAAGRVDVSRQRAPMVQVISDQAQAHMWDMAERVALRMKLDASPESRHLNRAWMCYDPHFWREAGEAILSIYAHYHGPQAREAHRRASSAALADIMDSRFFQKVFVEGGKGKAAATVADAANAKASKRMEKKSSATSTTSASAVGRLQSQDSMLALSLDLQRCSVTDLYALANRDGAKLQCHMLDLGAFVSSGADQCHGEEGEEALAGENGSGESDSSAESGIVMGAAEEGGEGEGDEEDSKPCPGSTVPARHNRGFCGMVPRDHADSVDSAMSAGAEGGTTTTTGGAIRSSQTVSSVLGVFDAIVQPYHQKVREVLAAPTLMDKMRAVWQSVDFLSRKTQEVCHDQGMDSLLPMSIFATASFSEDLFVQYFVQLLVLLDFKPDFTQHSIYDFSLSSAICTFMFLFESKFGTARETSSSLLLSSSSSSDTD